MQHMIEIGASFAPDQNATALTLASIGIGTTVRCTFHATYVFLHAVRSRSSKSLFPKGKSELEWAKAESAQTAYVSLRADVVSGR